MNEKFKIIEEYFPGLLQVDNGHVFFTDRSISAVPLELGSLRRVSGKPLTISIMGTKCIMYLVFRKGHDIAKSAFSMHYDFGLSIESCMGLYRYDIVISYQNPDDKLLRTYYDRQSIERQATINNIIN